MFNGRGPVNPGILRPSHCPGPNRGLTEPMAVSLIKYILLPVFTVPAAKAVVENVAVPVGMGLMTILMLCVPDTSCQAVVSVVKIVAAVDFANVNVDAFAARLQESRTAK